jgi:AcrR family transcriptional regulator
VQIGFASERTWYYAWPIADEPPIALAAEGRAPRVRGRRLRASILKCAADLASVDGLDQVSIGRLAAAMQMSKSGLYAYFTSKQDLQLATIECAWAIFERDVLEPGDDDLDALLERWIGYYEREVFPGGCLFITAGMEFANRDGAVHDALAAALERQLTALERAVSRARDDGRLPAATEAGQLAFELYAVLTAGNQRFRISRNPTAFAHARRAAERLLQSSSSR